MPPAIPRTTKKVEVDTFQAGKVLLALHQDKKQSTQPNKKNAEMVQTRVERSW